MSFKSIFHLDDKKYNVLQCNYNFHQNSDVNGRPSGKSFLTRVNILLEVKDITMFLLWATHPTMQKHFTLEHLPRIAGTKGRKIYGFDVNCVKYTEEFNATSNTPHTVRLELTCGGFEEGNAKYSTTWRKTFTDTVPVTTINYNEEEEEEPEVIDYYLTDDKNKKIEDNIEQEIGETIFLYVHTKNLIGELLTINLDNKTVDFKYNGDLLENDILSDYEINNNVEKIELEVIRQKN